MVTWIADATLLHDPSCVAVAAILFGAHYTKQAGHEPDRNDDNGAKHQIAENVFKDTETEVI